MKDSRNRVFLFLYALSPLHLMLITDRKSPMIAEHDIKCFKVMVELNGNFYVCPPVYQYFLQKNIPLVEYHMNTLYSEEANDSEKDYRKDGYI